MTKMETKIFTATFLSETNVYRQVSGKQLQPNETLTSFIVDRAVPLLREKPISSEELMGGYKLCIGSELSITTDSPEPETVTVEVNKMNDPVFALKYLRDTYCTKKDKEVFNRVIEKLEKHETKTK